MFGEKFSPSYQNNAARNINIGALKQNPIESPREQNEMLCCFISFPCTSSASWGVKYQIFSKFHLSLFSRQLIFIPLLVPQYGYIFNRKYYSFYFNEFVQMFLSFSSVLGCWPTWSCLARYTQIKYWIL